MNSKKRIMKKLAGIVFFTVFVLAGFNMRAFTYEPIDTISDYANATVSYFKKEFETLKKAALDSEKDGQIHSKPNAPKPEEQLFTIPIDEDENTIQANLKLYRDIFFKTLTLYPDGLTHESKCHGSRFANAIITSGHCVSELIKYDRNQIQFTIGEFYTERSKKREIIGKLEVVLEYNSLSNISISQKLFNDIEAIHKEPTAIDKSNASIKVSLEDIGAIYMHSGATFFLVMGKYCKTPIDDNKLKKQIFRSLQDEMPRIIPAGNLIENYKQQKIKIGLTGKTGNIDKLVFSKRNENKIINRVFLIHHSNTKKMLNFTDKYSEMMFKEILNKTGIYEIEWNTFLNDAFHSNSFYAINPLKLRNKLPNDIGQPVLAGVLIKNPRNEGHSGTPIYDENNNYIGTSGSLNDDTTFFTLMNDKNLKTLRGYLKKAQSFYQ